MTGNQTPRQNRDGHPCPPWCTIDHVAEHARAHTIAAACVDVPGKCGPSLPDVIMVRPAQLPYDGELPEVAVTSVRYGRQDENPGTWLKPDAAQAMAGIIEMLAAATQDQHRELAAAIRQAADITEGP